MAAGLAHIKVAVPIESQALRSIYRNYEKIHTTFEPTATGIVVVQTSSDPATE